MGKYSTLAIAAVLCTSTQCCKTKKQITTEHNAISISELTASNRISRQDFNVLDMLDIYDLRDTTASDTSRPTFRIKRTVTATRREVEQDTTNHDKAIISHSDIVSNQEPHKEVGVLRHFGKMWSILTFGFLVLFFLSIKKR